MLDPSLSIELALISGVCLYFSRQLNDVYLHCVVRLVVDSLEEIRVKQCCVMLRKILCLLSLMSFVPFAVELYYILWSKKIKKLTERCLCFVHPTIKY